MDSVENIKRILARSSYKVGSPENLVGEHLRRFLILLQSDDLTEARADIERAIDETVGLNSQIAKDFYDADALIDSTIRAFKMLHNNVTHI